MLGLLSLFGISIFGYFTLRRFKNFLKERNLIIIILTIYITFNLILVMLIWGCDRTQESRLLKGYDECKRKVEIVSYDCRETVDLVSPDLKEDVRRINNIIQENKKYYKDLWIGWMYSEKIANLEEIVYE